MQYAVILTKKNSYFLSFIPSWLNTYWIVIFEALQASCTGWKLATAVDFVRKNSGISQTVGDMWERSILAKTRTPALFVVNCYIKDTCRTIWRDAWCNCEHQTCMYSRSCSVSFLRIINLFTKFFVFFPQLGKEGLLTF